MQAVTRSASHVQTARQLPSRVSLDGYGAGPDQSLENPLGVGGEALHEWFVSDAHVPATMHGKDGRHDRHRRRLRRARLREHRRLDHGPQHVRPDPRPVARRRLEGLVGRQPAVPLRRSSCSRTTRARRSRWRAARRSTSSPTASTRRSTRAREAAGGKDVRIGGGAATIRQYLQAGLIDEMHLAISPVLLGARRAPVRRHRSSQGSASASPSTCATPGATHVVLTKEG